MKIAELHNLIAAIAPIDGINAAGDIWFKPEATPEQKAEALVILETNLPALEQ